MTSENIKWFSVPNPEGRNKPERMRSAAISDEGHIYVPAVIAGNEKMVFLCAVFDGTPVVVCDEHLFVRSDWMLKEFPNTREVLEKIEINVRSWA